MKPYHYASLILVLNTAQARWQSVYQSNFSSVYMQSTNGSLYRLPISANTVNAQDIENKMQPITSAPQNSSLVLDNDGHLLAVWGSQGCGAAPLEISQYDPSQNSWVSIAQSNSNTQKWYEDSQVVWLDRSEETIYIYGGACNGTPKSGFYRYIMNNQTFEQVESDNGIMPHEMADAQVIPLDDYQTLIVGGRAQNNTWISMQQIAIWGQGSWTFNPVSNSSGIDSRENPLLLPIWELGQNGTSGALSQILVVGGTVAGRNAEPHIVALNHTESTGWFWSVPMIDPDNGGQLDNVTFAAINLYNTLANVNTNSDVTLYGRSAQNTWNPVSSVSVPKQSLHTPPPSRKTSTAVIAVVCTLLPLIAIALILGGGWWWWRRRREQQLFLLSREGMLNRQDSAAGSSMHSWNNLTPGHMAPPHGLPMLSREKESDRNQETDSGSIMLMDDGNRLFMSKQRRNLRVVNPDTRYNDSTATLNTAQRHSSVQHSRSSSTSTRTPSVVTSRHSSSGSTIHENEKEDPFADDFDFGY